MNLQFETNTNEVELVGKITKDFTLSHEVLGENFYIAEITVPRQSETVDVIKIIASEYVIDNDYLNQYVHIKGSFRSYNNEGHLILSVFVNSIETITGREYPEEVLINTICIHGFLCKEPNHRRTPLGREICDINVAVNRLCGKSDYLPCIVWGRNAVRVSKMHIGDEIKLLGRIQSREYTKEGQKRIAYEVSVMKILG